jgi:hypothetical protein
MASSGKVVKVMYWELIVLGFVCFAAPWFARLAGYETGRKPFDLCGVARIFFLLAASFGLGMNLVDMLRDFGRVFMIISMVLGWISLAVGAVWGLYDVIRESYHGIARRTTAP